MLKLNHIDTDFLLSLQPCADRLENWLLYYKSWSGTVIDFLELEQVSYKDKRWVLFRAIFLDKKDVLEIACRLAEDVLPIFQAKYPKDDRPEKAILHARGLNFSDSILNHYIYSAAHAAMADAYNAENFAASHAATAAHFAIHNVHGAAEAALQATSSATYDSKNFHLKIIIDYIKEIT